VTARGRIRRGMASVVPRLAPNSRQRRAKCEVDKRLVAHAAPLGLSAIGVEDIVRNQYVDGGVA